MSWIKISNVNHAELYAKFTTQLKTITHANTITDIFYLFQDTGKENGYDELALLKKVTDWGYGMISPEFEYFVNEDALELIGEES